MSTSRKTPCIYIYIYIRACSRVKFPEPDSRARLVRVWAPLEKFGATFVLNCSPYYSKHLNFTRK
jgi:hypothetical protein